MIFMLNSIIIQTFHNLVSKVSIYLFASEINENINLDDSNPLSL